MKVPCTFPDLSEGQEHFPDIFKGSTFPEGLGRDWNRSRSEGRDWRPEWNRGVEVVWGNWKIWWG